ncbi:MAG: transcription termination/antitermination protein NusG [Treponema sp.]|nr:transcription termination/antitermination protein NusG [Treponema sp.]
MAKSWYILHTFTGYENKIEKTIRQYLDQRELDPEVVLEVHVPMETIEELKVGKDGKTTKKSRKVNFMPGYLLLCLELTDERETPTSQPKWKEACAKLRRIKGVTGFVGTNPNEKPRPISKAEADNLRQKMGLIKGGKPAHVKQSFNVDDEVKITDGPFATFTGVIKEVMIEKEMLKVEVQIFGRPTPVELSFLQAEKVI